MSFWMKCEQIDVQVFNDWSKKWEHLLSKDRTALKAKLLMYITHIVCDIL
jgi:hypothetical protein